MQTILQSKILKRAGRILMLILWIESTLRMLLVFKEDINVLERFIATNDTSEMCIKWLESNKNGSYKEVVDGFKMHFKEYFDAYLLLEEFWIVRDLLSHPQMSPDETVICMISDTSKKRKKDILRRLGLKVLPNHGIKISLDNKAYMALMRKLMKFDKEYFPKMCREIGINYDAIRWPIS